MYNGDGLDEESSSCKYVGIDMGGRGIDCGTGDGGSFAALLLAFGVALVEMLLRSKGSGRAALVEMLLRSKGSGRAPGAMGFLLGEVCPELPLLYDCIRALVTGGVEIALEECPGRR
jgi:hypothetical protein